MHAIKHLLKIQQEAKLGVQSAFGNSCHYSLTSDFHITNLLAPLINYLIVHTPEIAFPDAWLTKWLIGNSCTIQAETISSTMHNHSAPL